MNGHSVGTGAFYDLGFYDTERVEVLKGPQGTLFGRNAVNGVINIISKRPTSELEGSVDLTYGDYSQEDLTACFECSCFRHNKNKIGCYISKKRRFYYQPKRWTRL
jgi:outer membrane cobalamin receptor